LDSDDSSDEQESGEEGASAESGEEAHEAEEERESEEKEAEERADEASHEAEEEREEEEERNEEEQREADEEHEAEAKEEEEREAEEKEEEERKAEEEKENEEKAEEEKEEEARKADEEREAEEKEEEGRKAEEEKENEEKAKEEKDAEDKAEEGRKAEDEREADEKAEQDRNAADKALVGSAEDVIEHGLDSSHDWIPAGGSQAPGGAESAPDPGLLADKYAEGGGPELPGLQEAMPGHAGKSADAEKKSAAGAGSHSAMVAKPARDDSQGDGNMPALKRNTKAILVVAAIIAVVALSLLFAFGHNLLGVAAKHAATVASTTTISQAHTSNTQENSVLVAQTIAMQTSNSMYFGQNVMMLSGSISPVPSLLATNVLVSITNPNGTVVSSARIPLSSSGRFGENVSLGTNRTWVNGTYAVTSDYYGSSNTVTFVWKWPYVPPGLLVNTLCYVYSVVHNDIFLLCIFLLILGAVTYSLGHLMPGSHKSTFQNYGIGMIIGALIGIAIAVLALYALKFAAGKFLPVATCVSSTL
jgi:hypothetical protein